jgi:hypothetical protein
MRGDRAGRRAYAQAIPVVGPGARARERALPRAPAKSPHPSPRVLHIVTSTPHDALVRGIFGDAQRVAFGRHLLDFEFVLDDLARQTDAQILGRASDAIVRLTLLALRNARANSRLFELVAAAMSTMRNDLRGREVGPAIARLARHAVKVDDVSFRTVQSAFENSLVPTEWSEAMFSTADQLQAEARRDILLEQLEIKFGNLDPATRVRVEKASPEQVIAWLRRMVVVHSLEKVFAE